MTTTELIELLKRYEKGSCNRSREVSFHITGTDNSYLYLHNPTISFCSSGNGIAGAELCLTLSIDEELEIAESE